MKKFDGMTDEELALRYVDGDNRAFDELLTRTQEKLFTYIMFMVKDEDRANDVFQETFVKVIAKLHEGKYQTNGKFYCWLTRIAHNVIMDNYRSQRSERIVELGEDNDLTNVNSSQAINASHESELVNAQVLCDVKKLMNSLPDAQREVVFMRFFQQLSFKEIAEITGVSINTSLGRMRYALINLRKMARDHRMELMMETF